MAEDKKTVEVRQFKNGGFVDVFELNVPGSWTVLDILLNMNFDISDCYNYEVEVVW